MPDRDSSGRSITLRPLRAGDAGRHQAFIAGLATEDLRFRFGERILAMSEDELARIARVDPRRERTVVATRQAGNDTEIVGEVRLREHQASESAEFAIAVRSDVQRSGIGRALLEEAIAAARSGGIRFLYGLVARENAPMLGLASRLGFELEHVPGASTVVVSLDLGVAGTPSSAQAAGP